MSQIEHYWERGGARVVTMAAVTRGYGHSLTSKGQANFINVLFYCKLTKNLSQARTQ